MGEDGQKISGGAGGAVICQKGSRRRYIFKYRKSEIWPIYSVDHSIKECICRRRKAVYDGENEDKQVKGLKKSLSAVFDHIS